MAINRTDDEDVLIADISSLNAVSPVEINYDANGGELSVPDVKSFRNPTDVVSYFDTNASKGTEIFDGWFTAADGGNMESGCYVGFFSGSGPVTLYASLENCR